MADDQLPTGTTEGATGTTAKAADGSAAPPADGSAGQESIEELRKQLQETQRKNEQLLSEKSNVEREREELRRHRETAGQSTPPTVPVDPLDAQMEMQAAIIARYGKDSYEGQVAMANLYSLSAAKEQRHVTHFMVQMERDLLKVPAENRDEVKAKVLNGEFASVAQAHEAVKGSRSTSTIEKLQRELDDLRARVNGTPRVADVSTAVRTQVDAATHKKVMGLDEYTRIVEQGGDKARSVMAQVDAGDLKIDYGT